MSAVNVKEAAAIGAEHFNGFLRSYRACAMVCSGGDFGRRFSAGVGGLDSLRLEQFHGVVGTQILGYALRNQQERIQDAGRNENPQPGPRHINPEIADRLLFTACNPRMKAIASAIPTAAESEVVVRQARQSA